MIKSETPSDQLNGFAVLTFDLKSDETADQPSGMNLESFAQQNVIHSNPEQCQSEDQENEEDMSMTFVDILEFEEERLEKSNNNVRKSRTSKPCPLSVKNAKSSKPGISNFKSSRVIAENPKPSKPTSKPSGTRSKVVVKASVLKPTQDKARRVVKRDQTYKQTQKYKCPECPYSAAHVSSIYTHSASIHYLAQLSNLQKKGFMMTSSKDCVQCPGRSLKSLQMYSLHVGGKHKLIHRFISHDKKILYDQLPIKNMNSGYNQSKLQKALKCLICNGQKNFHNITEYKQHLAVVHFRDQIKAELKTKYPDHLKNLTCFLCHQAEKAFKHESALVNHLVSYVFTEPI